MRGARDGGPAPWRALCQDSRDPERQKHWAELFDQLDTNKDGRVDINELREGLARMGMNASSQAEQVRAGRAPVTGGARGLRVPSGWQGLSQLHCTVGKLRHGVRGGRDMPRVMQ